MFCTSCGKVIDDNAQFCIYCGAKTNGGDAEPAAPSLYESPTEEPAADSHSALTDTPAVESAAPAEDNFGETSSTEAFSDTPNEASPLPDTEDLTVPEPEAPASDLFTADTAPSAEPESYPDLSSSDQTSDALTNSESAFSSEPVSAPEEPAPTNSSPYDDTVTIYHKPKNIPNDEPVQPAPEPAIPPVAPVQQENVKPVDEAPVKVGAGRLFGATILTIFTIIFLIVFSLLLSARFGLTGGVLGSRVKKLDPNIVLSAELDGDEVSNDIYKIAGVGKVSDWNADKTSFKSFLIKSDLFDYAGEQVNNYADYILEGKGDDPSINSDDFAQDFFGSNSNNRIAEDEFDFFFDSDAIDDIAENIRDNDFDDNLSIENWNDEAGFDLENLKYAVSYITIGILFAVVVLFLIFIVLAVDKRGRFVAGFFGNTFFISGLVMLIVGLAVLGGTGVAYLFTGNVAFYLAGNLLLPFGVVAVCTAGAELILGYILKKVKKSIKRKERAKADK